MAAPLVIPRPVPEPETLHPTLWRAHQLGRSRSEALATGFPELDVQLPGGGWPRRQLTELLLPHAGVGELRLVAAGLQRVVQSGRTVMLFDPPAAVCTPGWAALGVDPQALVLVQARAPVRGPARELLPSADVLWALEQALKSGHVGAIVAWLPARLRADVLRRLQLAAQAHDGPAFILRESAAAQRPSPAPLRLGLQPAGADRLAVRVLKRRGPALPAPLVLALPPVLQARAPGRVQTPGTAGPAVEIAVQPPVAPVGGVAGGVVVR
jgi:protein ImuA